MKHSQYDKDGKMKIIEKNNRVQCQCGCIMEYEKSDIHKRKFSEMRNQIFFIRDYYEITYIECPQCGKEIEINCQYVGHH